jgi:signal transduction histidine kinase
VKILVVDDDPIAAEIASETLRLGGFDVAMVLDGEEGWRRVAAGQVEIVITDWMMPGLDGLELCRRTRALASDPYIYVILVTARDDASDVVEGLAAGADEFVRKPFSPMELVARVSAIRRVKELHDRIAEQNRQLKQAQELRRDWTNMIVHDLRSPLAVIQGSAEMLRMKAQPQQVRSVDRIWREAARVQTMLEQMLVMAKSDAERLRLALEECALKPVIADVVDSAAIGATGKSVQILVDATSEDVRAEVDLALWRRMVENLVGNAVKFTPAGGTVSVTVGRDGDEVRLAVADDGPGVPPADRERIFGQFEISTTEGAVLQHGLGLAFCKLVAEAHGGRVTYRPVVPRGSCFEVRHPGCRPDLAQGVSA